MGKDERISLSSLPQNIPMFYRIHREIFKKYNSFFLIKNKRSGKDSDSESQIHFDSFTRPSVVLFVLSMIESVGIIEQDN